MCGLAGIARVDGTSLDAEADGLLRRMSQTVAHRGPDDVEVLRDGPVGLAFTRLSLVDLVGGGQPLHSGDGSLVLIANGEIYNHRELAATLPADERPRTGSDCEVLIGLYRRDGLRFLDEVRGMFAFVLWDRRENKLLFGRDRFGVKPLFYHLNRDRVVFGSEMKTLFCDQDCPRELDWQAAIADQSLTKQPAFATGPVNTWFRDVELVEAATIVTVDLRDGRTSTHRYWSLPDFSGGLDLSEAEFVDAYRELLVSAVDDCGMADVEIGLFLSGGIDSAAVAALTGPATPLRTFTALNGSTLANGDAEHGHRIARMLGLPNHQVLHDTATTPTAEEWKRLVWLLESPVVGPEIYYKHEMYRYVRLAHPTVKAMLLGAGSDEFNGGYSVTVANGGDWQDYLAALRGMARRPAQAANPDLAPWWEHSEFPLLREDVLWSGADRGDPHARFFAWKYRDVLQYNCWHEDRTAAGNGIESRVPFLDHRLVELVSGIPDRLREPLLWNKGILRRAMRGVLPDEVVDRPKVPFFYGDGVAYTYRTFARMVNADDGALLEEALSGPRAKEFIDHDNARALAASLEQDPSSGHVEFLLHVLNLGLLEQFAAAPPAPPSIGRATTPPVAIEVADWDGEAEAIELLTLRRPEVSRDAVVRLADEVLLLHGPTDPDVWYVLVNGAVEYVVDAEESPDWAGFLTALSEAGGERTAGQVADAAGARWSELTSYLGDAVEFGLVRVGVDG